MNALARVQEKPELGRGEVQALRAWNFCDGWNPERLPVAFAFLRVDDAELTIDLMMEIRAYMNERRDFERRVAELNRPAH